jgi:hypothetical protein
MDWVLNVIDGVNGMEIESKRKARVVLFIKKIISCVKSATSHAS